MCQSIKCTCQTYNHLLSDSYSIGSNCKFVFESYKILIWFKKMFWWQDSRRTGQADHQQVRSLISELYIAHLRRMEDPVQLMITLLYPCMPTTPRHIIYPCMRVPRTVLGRYCCQINTSNTRQYTYQYHIPALWCRTWRLAPRSPKLPLHFCHQYTPVLLCGHHTAVPLKESYIVSNTNSDDNDNDWW